MQWIEVASPEGKKIPRWKRSAGLSSEGVVFVPAAMTGNESEVFLCAGYDGTPVVRYLNRVYVPADWLAVEFPKTAQICAIISKNVREACA